MLDPTDAKSLIGSAAARVGDDGALLATAFKFDTKLDAGEWLLGEVFLVSFCTCARRSAAGDVGWFVAVADIDGIYEDITALLVWS